MEPNLKTTPRIRGNTAATVAAAQRMRKEMTPAEAMLWEALRGKRLGGLRFRTQHPVGPFILDFYCPAAKLVVEADGSVHLGRTAEDEARTAQLAAYGYRTIRFTNEEITGDIEGVCARILAAARTTELPLTRPPDCPPAPDSGGDVGV